MSIASEITRINTNIANSYTAVDNKNGTLPQVQNSANLASAIDSIEVIESATAEGESLSLTNTKAMPYSDYVVKGKSEQATRSGKNLLNNTATSQTISGVTFTVNEDGSVTCNGTATNNIFFSLTENNSIENIILNGCPAGGSGDSYLVRAIDTNGRVLKTDFGEGTEVFNLINARIQIRIAKDYICNNLTFYPMIRLATIEDDTYEPYGASPSPDYPSEIHSVADDVNLFDMSTAVNGYINNSGTVANSNANRCSNYIEVELNDQYILSAYNENFVRYSLIYGVAFYDENKTFISRIHNVTYNTSFTIDNSNIKYIRVWQGVNVGQTIGYIKLQKGTVATPYSPYNQGTVTIKQRGKNLFDVSKFASATSNGITLSFNSDGNIVLNQTATAQANFNSSHIDMDGSINTGDMVTLSGGSENVTVAIQTFTSDDTYIGASRDSGSTVKYTIPNNASKYAFNIRIPSGTVLSDYVLKPQLEQGSQATPYEPYQGNDYTFQTEPLRSLPNGVKDTIEVEQYRKIEYLVFDGSDDEGWGSYTLLSNNIVQVGKPLSKTAKSRVGLSNRFSVVADYSSTEHIVIAGSFTAVYIHIDQTRFNTQDLAGFKEWLSNNPVTLQYELAEEIIEPLTQNQATTMLDIIKTGSYEGTTNIYTDEDVKPTIGVGYYKKG